MSGGNNSKDSSIAKRIASNLPRAGLLAIPYVGSAIEKAIFGPLDDKAREEARRETHDALDALRSKMWNGDQDKELNFRDN